MLARRAGRRAGFFEHRSNATQLQKLGYFDLGKAGNIEDEVVGEVGSGRGGLLVVTACEHAAVVAVPMSRRFELACAPIDRVSQLDTNVTCRSGRELKFGRTRMELQTENQRCHQQRDDSS